jgi:hypothetical protein
MTENQVPATAPTSAPEPGPSPQWGPNAPRGARAVLNRIIKEGATVPLFLGQTLVNSLRDLGYDHPTAAVCEHVDNAIQWGAKEVRVYFHQSGKRGNYAVDVLVWDNGRGMAPNVLRAAMAFGGSMCFDNRAGIGRYGVGMKGAALGMGPVLDVYSWQERGDFYNLMLDTDEISNDKSNLVTLPEPQLRDVLSPEIRTILTEPLAYPSDPEEQELLESDPDRLTERLGDSGTIIYIPDCDRMPKKKAQPLADHATKEMARIYRRQLDAGLRLFVNNRRVEPFDPTYWLESSRHTKIEGLTEKRSRLFQVWDIQIPVEEDSRTTRPIKVRLFALPIAAWSQLPRKTLKNDLKVFDEHNVSFMRNGREVAIGTFAALGGSKHHTNNWWRLELEFSAELDEAFGVAVNKQGVRPKHHVLDLIKKVIKDDLRVVKDNIVRYWSEQAAAARAEKSRLSEAERRANEADPLQATLLPHPTPRTEEEEKALEQNLRGLAATLKRGDETDDEAFQRVKNSTFITKREHNEDTPFYRVDFQLGKVILTINSAHPFFTKLYEPLSRAAKAAGLAGESGGDTEADRDLAQGCSEALVSLELLLMSLARTQSEMMTNDDAERQRTFDLLRKQWSMNLATQLTTP